ncbi:MAG: hypothetical protein KBS91_00900 [Firmicutes bacterium]|nr:hypothetical protein [Candidatus Caballimonas caccae]
MIDFYSVLKSTNAYKILRNDKMANSLSHAYLFLCPDKTFLSDYLKVLSKVIMCEENEPCLKCRNCNLIENNAHSDVLIYPKGDKGLNVEEVTNLINECYIKPIEGNKKLFVLLNCDEMNTQSQNKLLKTLEEPPKNVILLLGAKSEFPLLQTIKSRVKKIEISNLLDEVIFNALKDECKNLERLKDAISCSDKTLGKTLEIYNDENFVTELYLAKDLIIGMQRSSDVLSYVDKIEKSKVDRASFFSKLEIIFQDMLYILENKKELVKNKISFEIFENSKGYLEGSILHAISVIEESKKRRNFNANETMLNEWVLFQILEGKYKWQKL